jgi:phosphoribosylamine--glycine ligase
MPSKRGLKRLMGKRPKKFLFVADEALNGDLAWQVVREGHKVKMYVRDRADADVFTGFVERVGSWKPWVAWADVIVFDDENFGHEADRLRKKGKAVIGGSKYTDKLEANRDFGQQEMRKHGVNVLPSWQFTDYDEAIAFIKRKKGRFVFKPSGHVDSDAKDLIFIGQYDDASDLLEHLDRNKHVLARKAKAFLLQKYVNGVEVAVGAFFNGKRFIYPINVNFEHKRLFPGDLGPFTGEMGTLMYWSPPNALFKQTLAKMLPSLKKSGYVGYIDINCIVNGNGIYPLEFTSRFGYPTIQIQSEGIKMKASEWLYLLAKGQNFELECKKGFQVGVVILVPLYFGWADRSPRLIRTYKNLAIAFGDPEDLKGVHLGDIRLDENGIWRIAGISGWLLVITGHGSTVSEARHLAYERIKNVKIPNMFYRTDIGAAWTASDGDKLQTWGYLH